MVEAVHGPAGHHGLDDAAAGARELTSAPNDGHALVSTSYDLDLHRPYGAAGWITRGRWRNALISVARVAYAPPGMRAAQLIVFGIVTGSFLLLATMGFALARQVEGFLNIAHAQYMAVAAFTAWYLNVELGWHFLIAAPVAVAFTAVVALVVARLFYDPIKAHGPLVLLITSVGVVFVLEGFLDAIFGGGTRKYDIPRPESYTFWELRVTNYQLLVVGLALATTVSLASFLNKTNTGLTIRAMAINRELAASRAVNIKAASRAMWLVSGALAGVAGVVLAVLGTLTPELAFDQFLTILAVAILAGLGSLYSVSIAALIIGVSMDLSLLLIPGGWRPVIPFAIVIIVLVLRPTGLGRAEAT